MLYIIVALISFIHLLQQGNDIMISLIMSLLWIIVYPMLLFGVLFNVFTISKKK